MAFTDYLTLSCIAFLMFAVPVLIAATLYIEASKLNHGKNYF